MIDNQIRKSQVNAPNKKKLKIQFFEIQRSHNIPITTMSMHAILLFML
jgi:hypothetical protein